MEKLRGKSFSNDLFLILYPDYISVCGLRVFQCVFNIILVINVFQFILFVLRAYRLILLKCFQINKE